MQIAAPGSAANVPMGHSVLASDEFEPDLSRYDPSGTFLHSSSPSSSAYVPTGHGAHSAVPGSAANVPTGFVWHGTQSSAFLDPSKGR